MSWTLFTSIVSLLKSAQGITGLESIFTECLNKYGIFTILREFDLLKQVEIISVINIVDKVKCFGSRNYSK